MKLKEVFEKSVQFFKDKKIDNARLDAELLISHALKIERVHIYVKYEQPLSETEITNCREAIRRRVQGEPVAYITGEKGFYGEMFSVGEGVLIPRPETELIVEEALAFIKLKDIKEPKILDLGAGSGCIGFSILKNCKTASLISIEKSEAAYKYLANNQERLKLTERSQIVLGDVLDVKLSIQKFDIIVANPPYIAENDPQTELNVKKFEPHAALFCERNGYAASFDWSAKFKDTLNSPGMMLFEMGHQQGAELKQHFEKLASDIKILKDLSGLDRVIKCTQ
ncbi:MAG: peptide chain release factor N(5)-glutamine methyltransferase [Bdellovibrionota bacterium]